MKGIRQQMGSPLYGEGCIVCKLANGGIMVINEHTHPDAIRGFEFTQCFVYETVSHDMKLAVNLQTRPKNRDNN